MGGMVRKLQEKMRKILLLHFPVTLHQMVYYFIQAINFLKNIKMARLSFFMVHGTERPNHRKVILWFSFRLKMVNQAETGKYLPMDFRADLNLQHQEEQSIVHAELRRRPMVQ